MNNKVKKLEQIYSSLLEISKQISELLDRSLFSELVVYFTKKDALLKDASLLIEDLKNISDFDKSKLSAIAKDYAAQEKINIQKMQTFKAQIKDELAKTNKDKKLLSAYNSYKEYSLGGILDFWE